MKSNRNLLGLILIFALMVGGLSFFGNQDTSSAAPVFYKNCVELNKKYKNGVASTTLYKNKGVGPIEKPAVSSATYKKNISLDKDKDGIACERVVEVSAPVKTPTTPDNAAEIAEPLSSCQLKETKNFTGAGAKGFPTRPDVSPTGKIKIALIPVDFSNAVGVGNPATMFKDDIQNLKDWVKLFSRGNLEYEIEFAAKDWIRAPKGAEWYVCVQCGKGAKSEKQSTPAGIQELVDTADAEYNFDKTRMVYFVFPEEAEQKYGTALYAHNQNLNSKDGSFTASVYGELGAGVGAKTDRTKIWDHAAHEFLHFQGFIGHGPQNGSGYYVSTDQWGKSKAVTSWEAFLNGWFGAEEVLCIDKAKITKDLYLSMDSIDTFGPGKESLMIRLSSDELIVLEYRDKGPFTEICNDCRVGPKAGFTAYRVNVNAASYRNDQDPDGESKNFWAYLRDGGEAVIKTSVEYSGVRLTPVANKQIKISIIK